MARRLLSCLGQCSRVFAVEFDKTDPVYFALSTKPTICHYNERQVLADIFGGGKIYSLHLQCENRIRKVKLYGYLKNKLSTELPSDCNVLEISSFLPNVKHSVIKGFLLKDKSDSVTVENILGELSQTDTISVFSCVLGEDGQYWWQQIWSKSKDDRMVELERYCVVPASSPEHHPSTLNIINSDVFYCVEDAYQVLQECSDIIPESQAVLKLVDQRSETRTDGGFPVIVIEGLDATGKTTLTESMREAIGATLLKSPPECLASFRQRFDSEPPLIRRAFYALGNYITAGQIGTESAKAPVIVDRYWHSTAAYAIATAVSGKLGNLPGPGSEVYRWPGDLLRPSLVLLLTVSPDERLKRLRVRGQEKTVEEAELEANHLFRQKVEEAYKRIENPTCVIVDASPSPDKVLQQVLLLIKNKCHL